MAAHARVEIDIRDSYSSLGFRSAQNAGYIEVKHGDKDAVYRFGAMPQHERIAVILAGMSAKQQEPSDG